MLNKSDRSSNHHSDYLDVTQHWSDTSEPYAGGDALVTFLARGWEIDSEVRVEERHFAGQRSVAVYHLTLERNGETLDIPVLRNPYVNRILRMGEFQLLQEANGSH